MRFLAVLVISWYVTHAMGGILLDAYFALTDTLVSIPKTL